MLLPLYGGFWGIFGVCLIEETTDTPRGVVAATCKRCKTALWVQCSAFGSDISAWGRLGQVAGTRKRQTGVGGYSTSISTFKPFGLWALTLVAFHNHFCFRLQAVLSARAKNQQLVRRDISRQLSFLTFWCFPYILHNIYTCILYIFLYKYSG